MKKRKKSSRMRAQTTHGYGSKKKHRGAGNKGGKGMAGSGKRAASKKPTIMKLYGKSYFGKRGFIIPPSIKKKVKTITLDYITNNLDKISKKEGEFYVIDANSLGYNKVLGSGKISAKIKISCSSFSKKAEEKIKEAKGEIIK